jgi:excisionase family DNA binding protein
MTWHPGVAAAGQRQEDKLLRPDQAALRLKCKPRWVRQLCQDRVLEAIKIGPRKWLIPESAIREYLASLNQD